jgi:hypothetical protein
MGLNVRFGLIQSKQGSSKCKQRQSKETAGSNKHIINGPILIKSYNRRLHG